MIIRIKANNEERKLDTFKEFEFEEINFSILIKLFILNNTNKYTINGFITCSIKDEINSLEDIPIAKAAAEEIIVIFGLLNKKNSNLSLNDKFLGGFLVVFGGVDWDDVSSGCVGVVVGKLVILSWL